MENEFVHITSNNHWFEKHPEKVAGVEYQTTSIYFPIQVKGTKEDVIRAINNPKEQLRQLFYSELAKNEFHTGQYGGNKPNVYHVSKRIEGTIKDKELKTFSFTDEKKGYKGDFDSSEEAKIAVYSYMDEIGNTNISKYYLKLHVKTDTNNKTKKLRLAKAKAKAVKLKLQLSHEGI